MRLPEIGAWVLVTSNPAWAEKTNEKKKKKQSSSVVAALTR
jgi:hypothetical protein